MDRTALKNPFALAIIALVVFMTLYMSTYIVDEKRQAIITSYGEYRRTASTAGLHFKIPFVEQINWVDKRILRVEMAQQEVTSTDQLRLEVDAFARFRVVDPIKMYRTVRTEENLTTQLRAILGSRLRNELGKRTFANLLSPERGQIMDNIQDSLNAEAKKYGVEIVDVRIKRADLPKGTPLESAFERMRTARQQEAVSIQAEGQKEAQIIRAEADAQAAKIYADAYGKDPDFYDFYRAMQSYRTTFAKTADGETTQMILSPDSDYMRQFSGRR
jgi:modulator of FtsH protease HflC